MLETRKCLVKSGENFETWFISCFNDHYDGMYRYAYSLIRNTEHAKDLVQNVFTNLWDNQAKIEIKYCVKSYLYTSVHNQSLNFIRAKKNNKIDSLDLNDPGNEHEIQTPFKDILTEKETTSKASKAIRELPPQCRLIFLKSRLENKKYAEIAVELNLSVKTIEVQISKALKILREKIQSESRLVN